MALLYGHAGRLTAQNGGFRPGQWSRRRGQLLRELFAAEAGWAVRVFAVCAGPTQPVKCGAGLCCPEHCGFPDPGASTTPEPEPPLPEPAPLVLLPKSPPSRHWRRRAGAGQRMERRERQQAERAAAGVGERQAADAPPCRAAAATEHGSSSPAFPALTDM